MNITSQSKSGSKTTFIINASTAEVEMINEAGFRTGGDYLITNNKSDTAKFEAFVFSINAPKAAATQAANVNKAASRYIELVNVAEQSNLNCGASWFCTGAYVDENFLPPHFEGEMICYVYNN